MSLQTKLLRWFAENARPLPWRRHCRPYEVWISEIMLQQTQMDTVLPYFERWIAAFPDIPSLARAEESRVLKLWQGLGYYSRARNLRATASEIAAKFGGEFPSDFETILKLRGIGRYTAGAIASIAFNQPRPIVDGNVLRVLSRLYAIRKNIDVPSHREKFWGLQEKLIPKNRAREFNQALMELGALVCVPKNPLCGECPLRPDCRAARMGNPEAYPVRRPRKKAVRVTAAALAVQKNGAYLLLRRPVGKIMGGLWEFPEWKLPNGGADAANVKKLAGKSLGLTLSEIKKLGTIKRNYTHHLESLHVFSTRVEEKGTAPFLHSSNLKKGAVPFSWQSAWVRPSNFKRYPFSSAHAKIAALIQ